MPSFLYTDNVMKQIHNFIQAIPFYKNAFALMPHYLAS
jgi:hypothetical protein